MGSPLIRVLALSFVVLSAGLAVLTGGPGAAPGVAWGPPVSGMPPETVLLPLTAAYPSPVVPAGVSAYPSPVVPTVVPGAQTQGPDGWVIQVIARGLARMTVGWDASLALDSAGRPHLAYLDKVRGGLWYAKDLGADWRFEPIDPAAEDFISLSLGPGDIPHVAYCLYGCNGYVCLCRQLRYAHRDGPSWVTETLRIGFMGAPALDVDAAGRPHLAYAEWNGAYEQHNRLLYLSYDGTNWISETVADDVDAPSLALDAAGQPRVGYVSWKGGETKDGVTYAVRGAAGWYVEVVDAEVRSVSSTSLALDAAGRPHLSYVDHQAEGESLAKYAFHDGAAWRVEAVGGPGQFGGGGALAVDAVGHPHIVYQGAGGDDLAYAYRAASQWQVEVVDSEGALGYEPALALDAAGRPHIGYTAGYSLKYAWRQGAPVLPESGGPSLVGWLLAGALALVGVGLAARYAESRKEDS